MVYNLSTTGQEDYTDGMPRPRFRRLDVDERRRALLDLGEVLFTRHAYDELSMAAIARAAGISKALLYHYFPSKEAYFVATLEQHAAELAALTDTDPARAPHEQLAASLDAFLEWVEENEVAYRKLMQSATTVGEARALIEEVRDHTAGRLLDGLRADPSPKVRTAVRAWLWFMDGACLDWLEHRDMERSELRDLLVGVLVGALAAAGFDLSKLAEPAGEPSG